MKKLMNKISENYDIKMMGLIIVIGIMTAFGVYRMEYEWCEWMTGVIWIIGEILVVGVLTYRPATRIIVEETKKLYEKMLED